jgi:hypothetical protein
MVISRNCVYKILRERLIATVRSTIKGDLIINNEK